MGVRFYAICILIVLESAARAGVSRRSLGTEKPNTGVSKTYISFKLSVPASEYVSKPKLRSEIAGRFLKDLDENPYGICRVVGFGVLLESRIMESRHCLRFFHSMSEKWGPTAPALYGIEFIFEGPVDIARIQTAPSSKQEVTTVKFGGIEPSALDPKISPNSKTKTFYVDNGPNTSEAVEDRCALLTNVLASAQTGIPNDTREDVESDLSTIERLKRKNATPAILRRKIIEAELKLGRASGDGILPRTELLLLDSEKNRGNSELNSKWRRFENARVLYEKEGFDSNEKLMLHKMLDGIETHIRK